MRFGSLFSGIGGLDLGLERAGMECAWQVEIDPYCRRVLEKHWPDVLRFSDVKELTGDELAPVDLIAGGFPCQPVSRAGRRLAQADERWLWPEFARLVRVLRPRYVLVENVPGLLAHGMGDVLGDLAGLGFDAEWESIPAAAVGAPHLRDRIWIVAWTEHGRPLADSGGGRGPGHHVRAGRDASRRGGEALADAHGAGLRERRGAVAVRAEHDPPERGREAVADSEGFGGQVRQPARQRLGGSPSGGESVADSPSQRWGRRFFTREDLELDRPQPAYGHAGAGRDGDWWAVEPDVGRVAHGIPARVDRLRTLGNAVVPQIPERIGRRLMTLTGEST